MAKLIRGQNDLENWCRRNGRTDILSEWDYERNEGLNPSDVSFGTEKKVWWICSLSHSWQIGVTYRTYYNNGCPYCSGQKTLEGFNDFKTWCINNGRGELLEEWDYENNSFDPSRISPKTHKKAWWKCSRNHRWETAVSSRTHLNTGCPYCSGNNVIKGETDLQTLFPDIANEWNTNRNDGLLPSDVKSSSNRKVWWICSSGHEWEARVVDRIKSRGCPYCIGNKPIKGKTDLETLFPDIAMEWHPTKNGDLQPSDLLPYSNKRIWWICSNNHEWQALCSNRTRNGYGCPFCNKGRGVKVISGVNDLLSLFPEIAKDWNFEKNQGLKNSYGDDLSTPDKVVAKSGQKVWWKCDKGHEWKASVINRVDKHSDCPYCRRRIAIKGETDLQTKYPEVAAEWHPRKNIDLRPTDVLPQSNRKVWWICAYGHEWETTIARRTHGYGCPECGVIKSAETRNENRIRLIGSLAENYTSLAEEWHPSKNGDMKPSDVLSHSNKKAWWLGNCGHEWEAMIAHRVKKNSGCPFCSNNQVLQGFNDLATNNPLLAKEWNYERNNGLKNGFGEDISTPDKVISKSGQKVWWICDKGHEWQAVISSRSGQNCGCPYCSGAGTSLPEQGVAFYLEQVCKIAQRIRISGNEVDVYLPNYNIGIEYDGKYYHTSKSRSKEDKKDKRLKDNGVSVIRIKESDSNRIENGFIYFISDNMGTNYEWAIKQLCCLLFNLTQDERFLSINIDVSSDILKIRERVDLYHKRNSISYLYPDIAKEWNYEKNGILTPEVISSKSNIKVWWRCSKGHEWQAIVVNRTNLCRGCPECGKEKLGKSIHNIALLKKGSLAENHPEIAKQWHPSKNGKLTPYEVASGSNIKVWWICECGNEWQASIGNRTGRKSGCPSCAKKQHFRPVRNIDTNDVFESIDDATKFAGLKSNSAITQCCQGKQKTAGGYRWEYADEVE